MEDLVNWHWPMGNFTYVIQQTFCIKNSPSCLIIFLIFQFLLMGIPKFNVWKSFGVANVSLLFDRGDGQSD